jgi:preprotein translocase SecE subunit
MKNGKLIFGIFSGSFLILAYFMTAASDAILGMRFIDVADIRLFSLLPVKALVGFSVAGIIIGYLGKGRKGYYVDQLDMTLTELKKVSFPTKEETKVTTMSVFVFVGIMIVVFVVFDLIWSNLSSLIY